MFRRWSARLYEILWLGMPVAIWFAYQPFFRLGQDGTMYFELSITMLYTAILALVGIPAVWYRRREIVKMRSVWVVSLFVAVSALSLLWTVNQTRGLLTIGVTGMLYVIFLAAVAERRRLMKILPLIIRVYLWSTIIMCTLAMVQFFAGLWITPDITLLCAGCVAEQFGFVRPSVFLIEPQFLGSALLPAVFILIWQIGNRQKAWWAYVALLVVVTVLILTLSRGALFACSIGVMVLLILSTRNLGRWIVIAGLFIASLVGALSLQGLAVVMNPAIDETFVGAITKSIHQLSMGVVDIRPTQANPPQTTSAAEEEAKQPNFDGYVEESTSARTIRTSLALQRWSANIPTILLGAGIGSAGMAMHEVSPNHIGAREIVQNEYIEILLERGLIGLASFIILLIGVLIVTRKQRWLWSIVAAIMVQWLFFSGYPNAMHVYIVLILIVCCRRD